MTSEFLTFKFGTIQTTFTAFIVFVLLNYFRKQLAYAGRVMGGFINRCWAQFKVAMLWLRDEANIGKSRGPLFVFVAIGVILRVCLVLVTDPGFSDMYSRLAYSHLLSDYYLPRRSILYTINPSPDWLPLHFYINAFFIIIGCETIHLRLFHAVVGIASSVFVLRLAKDYLSVTNSWVVMLAYLFYPASCVVSTQVLSEPLFLFSTLGAVSSYLTFYQKRKLKHMVMCSAWLFFGSLLRYEGWLLIGAFTLMNPLFLRPLNVKETVLLMLPWIGPLTVMYVLVQQGFSPMRGVCYSDHEVAITLSNSKVDMSLFLTSYKGGWVLLSVIAFVLFCVRYSRSEVHRLYMVFLCLFTLPFLIKNLRLEILPQYRYLVLYMPFFLIPTTVILQDFWLRVFGSNLLALTAISASLMFCSCFGVYSGNLTIPRYRAGLVSSLSAIESVEQGEFLVDHEENNLNHLWIVESKIPLNMTFVSDSLNKIIDLNAINSVSSVNQSTRISYMVSYQEYLHGNLDTNSLNETLDKSHKDQYLVLFHGGPLYNLFQFHDSIEHYREYHFEKRFEEGDISIYHKRL